MSDEIINVMIVKKFGHAERLAYNYEGMAADVSFQGTNDELKAVTSLNSGEVEIIVTGILGVDWEGIVDVVGPDKVIVYSAEDAPSMVQRVKDLGVTFVPVDVRLSPENLIEAIRQKTNRS